MILGGLYIYISFLKKIILLFYRFTSYFEPVKFETLVYQLIEY